MPTGIGLHFPAGVVPHGRCRMGLPQATHPNPNSVPHFAPLSLPPRLFVPQIPSPKHQPLKGLETFLPSHWVETNWRRSPGSWEIKFPLAPHRSQLMEDTTPSSSGSIRQEFPCMKDATASPFANQILVTRKPAFSLL